jgi:hypothetical protein
MTSYFNVAIDSRLGASLACLHDVRAELVWICALVPLFPKITSDSPPESREACVALAMWWCCVVRYWRCFGEGKRTDYPSHLLASLTPDSTAFHLRMKTLRHKFAAHPDGAFDVFGCGAMVDASDRGKAIGHWNASIRKHAPADAELAKLQELCIELVVLLDPHIERMSAKFAAEIEAYDPTLLATKEIYRPPLVEAGKHEFAIRYELFDKRAGRAERK